MLWSSLRLRLSRLSWSLLRRWRWFRLQFRRRLRLRLSPLSPLSRLLLPRRRWWVRLRRRRWCELRCR